MSLRRISQPFVYDYITDRVRNLPIGSKLVNLPIRSGVVKAFLSELPQLKSMTDLNWGGVKFQAPPLEMEAAFIAQYSCEKPQSMAIFECFFDENDLSNLRTVRFPYLILGDDTAPRPRTLCEHRRKSPRMCSD